jgi:putative membrane-bound dehydrogenase-like protein
MFPMRILARVVLCLAGAVVAPAASTFPEPHDSGPAVHPPMSPAQSAASFHVPAGFHVTVFAGEPEVRQPIAMAFDLRGRLWVAENYTYAENGVNFDTRFRDRLVILEDTDGDGRSDRRRVFWDQANILTSVEPMADGVYALCPPRLLFIPDRNHDDLPDGEPEVVLDGFETTTGNRHTFANGLKWGPDGWLWGRVGISSGARIGRPGQGEEGRVEMRGGIWRFHPRTGVAEAVCHGTTNPWGLDWNADGEPFFINTVIGHLWHAIPGAHFQRMHGDDVNPRSYALIPQHADHLHFDSGAGWTKSRASADGHAAAGSDALGGGHAHAGLMIYQGTNWPKSYRGGLFTWNLHGRRMNRERLERAGSGYVGRHESDVLSVGDPWFRGIDLLEGPDGSVFVADWSDTGECHEQDGVHRQSGRIQRIRFGQESVPSVPDMTGLGEEALVDAVLGQSEWASRAARKVWAHRGMMGPATRQRLERVLEGAGERTRRLRALWALHAAGVLDVSVLLRVTRDEDEHLRSWAVRLLSDGMAVATPRLSPGIWRRIVQRWEEMARTDGSALVRLYLAGGVQRLDAEAKERVATGLAARVEDASDPNLGLVLWQGIEGLGTGEADRLGRIALAARIPVLRRHGARRLAEDAVSKTSPALERMIRWAASADAAIREDVLEGMSQAFRGMRRVARPAGWDSMVNACEKEPALRERCRDLEVVMGDGRAIQDLMALVRDGKADVRARRAAVRALVESRADGLGELLRPLVQDGSMRVSAILALLELGIDGGAEIALRHYPWLGLEERGPVVSAMASRREGARALLGALARGTVQRPEISAFDAARMVRLDDPEILRLLTSHWGTVGVGAGGRRAEIENWRTRLTPAVLAGADMGRGRAVFGRVCAGCHRMHGEGGDLGPDLTGSGRTDLGYLLENVVDPGAVVAAEQRATVVTMKDGRVLTGMLSGVNDRTLTLKGVRGADVLVRGDVERWETLEQSMMPEGLLESLGNGEAVDLLGYLMRR